MFVFVVNLSIWHFGLHRKICFYYYFLIHFFLIYFLVLLLLLLNVFKITFFAPFHYFLYYCKGTYGGQVKELPLSNISLINVSMGVFPTNRTKNSCSITCELTDRSDGSRNSSLPKRIGWFGYVLRQYSSSAHWDFSCNDSMWAASERPIASIEWK